MEPADITIQGLVHDLNNVFQTIHEAAGVLAHDVKWERVSAALERSAERGKRIAESIEESARSPEETSTVVRRAVESAQDYLECIHAHSLAFSLDIEPAFRLPGNAAAWERVLVNLILNAAQAGASRVEIAARPGEIRIEDDGPGISADVLPYIFEPHVSTRPERSGLGLSIVRSIVAKNGGTVAAHNRDRGAAFTIRMT
ncbi:MAG TPA: HAMP domain-containing sensor histidine kinase [Bryobacteraceae bacterium]|jgi:signal transduction histidine kinase|nr:HAMP domain-containing sensor histidine kinase [Bryobacteraceae bacterium]